MTIDLFKIENSIEPQKGLALISEPLSDDNYFGRSVVLLTEHGNEGSVGFVLNKKTEYILSDLIKDLDSEFTVYQGGPVQPNTLHYIHSLDEISNSVKIDDGLFWGGDFDQIKEMLDLGLVKESQIQFFIGYSGWSPDQLNEELEKHYWIIAEVEKKEILLNQSDHFWREKVELLGDKYKLWLNVPKNPSLN